MEALRFLALQKFENFVSVNRSRNVEVPHICIFYIASTDVLYRVRDKRCCN